MRINVKESVADVPMLKVRHFLRERDYYDTQTIGRVAELGTLSIL